MTVNYSYDVLLSCGCVVRKNLWTPIPHGTIELNCPTHGIAGLELMDLLQVTS